MVKVTKGNGRQAKGNAQLTRLHADEVCVNFQVCQSLVLHVLLPDKINFNVTDCGADGVTVRRVLLGRWPSGSLFRRCGSTVTCYQCPMYGPLLALTDTYLWVCCIKAHEDIIRVVADHFNIVGLRIAGVSYGRFMAMRCCKLPYFSIDNAHLMYNAHPELFRHSF